MYFVKQYLFNIYYVYSTKGIIKIKLKNTVLSRSLYFKQKDKAAGL